MKILNRIKRAHLLLIILLISISTNIYSQENKPTIHSYYNKSTNKWGFTDSHDSIIIKPIYDWVSYTEEGCFIVKLNDKYNFINEKGKLISPIYFSYVHSFSEGLAAVKIENKYGFINRQGKLVISDRFDNVNNFSNGIAIVKINKKWGGINKEGQFVIQPLYYDIENFEGEFAKAKIKKHRKIFYGIIDREGSISIPFKYNYIFDFDEDNIAQVFIGKTGHTKLRRLPRNWGTYGGRRWFDGLFGYVNIYGDEIIPPIYESKILFIDDLAVIERKGKVGLVNKKGQIIIPVIYGYLLGKEDVILVEKKRKWGFIDLNGNIVIPLKFNYLEEFNYVNEKLEYAKFYSGKTNSNGYPIDNKGKWGFINKSGQIVIPAIYDSVGEFSGKKSNVRLGEENFYIDINGNRISP